MFLGILLVAIYTIQYAIDYRYKKISQDKISLLMKHKIDSEVMIFGSSVAYAHFNSFLIQRKTGLTAYNMGWDGLFFVQYNGLIKEYLSYEKKCKVIVIACDFDNLSKNDLITRPDLFYSYLSNPYIYSSLYDIEPEKIAKARFFPGYKFTILGRTFYNHFIDKNVQDKTNGFDPRNLNWTGADTFKAFNARYEKPIYENLKATINDITKKGIKVLIVMTPVYKDGYKLILNADQIKSYYRALTNDNIYFVDYTSDSICNNKAYFYNNSHMNAAGADIFSNEVSDQINHLGINGLRDQKF